MPEVETHSLFAFFESNDRNDKVFRKRFVDAPRRDREDTIIDNFLGSGVKVARDTLTCVGRENGDFDPAFRGFRREARFATAA